MSRTVTHGQWSLEPYCIGLKLRSLRTEKRMTLSRLAAETGLSTALLSKLETDRMTPTLSTLAAICRVYGVGLGHFFAEPARHTLSVTRKAHLQGAGHGADAVTVTPLNIGGNGQLRAELIELSPGNPTTIRAQAPTTGVLYVLEGILRLDAGGMHEVLDAGDCLCVDSDMPLAWSAGDKNRCRVLAVMADPQQAG